jgi:hypothetical protein
VASNQEHNQLIKICFDGNKHLKHVLSSEEIVQMTMIENRFPLTKLPVCGSCERLAMWSAGMQATCRHCGTITKSPVTYSSYLSSGYDVDATGKTAKSVMEKNKKIRELILPEYRM